MHSHCNSEIAGPHNGLVDQLKKLRQDAGLTQGQLAEKSGLSQSFISRLERGETEITSENLRAIADALGKPVSRLYPPTSAQGRLWAAVEKMPPGTEDRAAELLETLLAAIQKPPR